MKTWQPKCDSPPEGVNYVSGADLRSTLDIVWSCLTILLLCTWSILHLNVPPQLRPRSWRQSLHRSIFLAQRKLKWMATTLIAPEIILGKAIVDRLSARFSKRKMAVWAARDEVEWEAAHAFLANMGGWCLRFGDRSSDTPLEVIQELPKGMVMNRERKEPQEDNSADAIKPITTTNSMPNPFTRSGTLKGSWKFSDQAIDIRRQDLAMSRALTRIATHIASKTSTKVSSSDMAEEKWIVPPGNRQDPINMFKKNTASYGDSNWVEDERLIEICSRVRIREHHLPFQDSKGYTEALSILQTNVWPLDAYQLFLCREMGLIAKLPDISTDEIGESGKADFLIKVLAATQLAWFIIQLIGRAVEHVAVTQLEITVVANAACALLTYLLNLAKPKDVPAPIYLPAARYPTPQEMHRIACNGPFKYGPRRRTHCVPDNSIHKCEDVEGADQLHYFGIASAIAASLFGALHFLAWNFHFPSTAELWLWHTASIVITILPLVMVSINLYFLGFFVRNYSWKVCGVTVYANILLLGTVVGAFTVCRTVILVETFRTLAYLEPSAFVATWSQGFPQIQ